MNAPTYTSPPVTDWLTTSIPEPGPSDDVPAEEDSRTADHEFASDILDDVPEDYVDAVLRICVLEDELEDARTQATSYLQHWQFCIQALVAISKYGGSDSRIPTLLATVAVAEYLED